MTTPALTADRTSHLPPPRHAVHAACLFDIPDLTYLPPSHGSYELDLEDPALRRLAFGAAIFSATLALAGMVLAAVSA